MQRIGKMLLALAVVILVFGGTNAFATSRGCSLSNAKTVETTYSCTVKSSTGTYKVQQNKRIASLSDWQMGKTPSDGRFKQGNRYWNYFK